MCKYKDLVKLKVNSILEVYFKHENFDEFAFTPKDKGKIEAVLQHVVDRLGLGSEFALRSNEQSTNKQSRPMRLWLRSYLTYKLNTLSKSSKYCIRIRYGYYRPSKGHPHDL